MMSDIFDELERLEDAVERLETEFGGLEAKLDNLNMAQPADDQSDMFDGNVAYIDKEAATQKIDNAITRVETLLKKSGSHG